MNKNIDYIVKPEERVVVGKYSTYMDVQEWMDKYPKWKKAILKVARYTGKHPYYPEMVKGIARCSEDDEFNEVTGKKLAEQKVNAKRHERIAKEAYSLSKMFEELMHDMDALYDFHCKKVDAINADIDRHFRGRMD